MSILADQAVDTHFAVGDQVKVLSSRPDEPVWTITEIVTDNPEHDGPYAILHDADGERSWSALRILIPVAQCPAWCAGHLDGEDGLVHISGDQVIATSSGPEQGEVYVSVEQAPTSGTAVRLSGAADQPMTPAQALELAQALTVAAFAAVAR